MSKSSPAGLPDMLPAAKERLSRPLRSKPDSWKVKLGFAVLIACAWWCFKTHNHRVVTHKPASISPAYPLHHGWKPFPRPDDPFHFLPCTNETSPPRLDDPHPLESWKQLYESDPGRWLRGTTRRQALYLCGWLDVPLDYTNVSDTRIARLAVTRFQLDPFPSNRTLVVPPGGPGGSGTQWVLSEGELISNERSNGTFDVLG